MRVFIAILHIFTLVFTVWSMDKTQGNHNSPKRNDAILQSSNNFHGLSYTGNGVEKHLIRQKVPKEERANVRWEKLKELTAIRAKALTRHSNERYRIQNILNDSTYKTNHAAKYTRHHENNLQYLKTKKAMVQGYNDVLHAAEGDLKIYQSHNGEHVPKHASVQSLREVIRQEYPSYVSPPESPVRSGFNG